MRYPVAFLSLVVSLSAPLGAAAGPGPYGDLAPFARAADPSGPAAFRQIARTEAAKAGLPYDLADAVMKVESGYDPTRIGGVGEIGLMQVRPATAAMLGFRGTNADLAVPATNIHYGVAYLAEAWRRAAGDVCRTLMKYRAGHGQEAMSPRSVEYCSRAKAHLMAQNSIYARGMVVPVAVAGASDGAPVVGVATLRTLRGAAFWAAETARVRKLTAAVHARWQRVAAR